MKYRSALGWCASISVIVMAGLLVARSTTPRARLIDNASDLEAIRVELNALKRSHSADRVLVSQLANRALELSASESRAQVNDTSSDDTPEALRPVESAEETPDLDDVKAVNRVQQLQLVSHLDDLVDGEDFDPDWSQRAGGSFTKALTAGLPEGSTVSNVECRSTLCRAETTHQSVDAFVAYNEAVFMSPERQVWNGGMFSTVVEETSSGVTAVSFIAKEGAALPVPETEGE